MTLVGVLRYEFLMQVRRPVMWLVLILVALLSSFPFLQGLPIELTGLEVAAGVTHLMNTFMPIAFGILLADRLPRDRRLNTNELLASFPSSAGTRLWGKFLGAAAATAVPLGALYLVVAGMLAMQRGDASILAFELPLLILTVLPGLILVGAFSMICTEFLPVPLYTILFIGYWFWGNVVSPSRIPTLACTPLTPIGGFAEHGILGTPGGLCSGLIPPITPAQGWLSIALLIGVAAVAMLAGQFYSNWRMEES